MRKKILHVIDQTGPGGAQVILGYILKSLQQDFEFHVAVLGQSGHYSQTYRDLGVPVHELSRSSNRFDPLSFFVLLRLISREQVDLLHTHLFKSHIFGGLAARLLMKKIVIQDHSAITAKRLEYIFSHHLMVECYLFLYKKILHQADVFLLTSQQEAFSIVILEAMACGCPIVAAANTGAQSILTHGYNGLLAPVGDEDKLSKMVLRIMSDDRLARDLASHARDTVCEKYDMKLRMHQIRELYVKLLD